ncbi:hypothetical protein [Frigoriflavimonas asaccharolytica]|uniref:Uncharacterized protein n=1 Tax=Frigoriflavimonas asaccharolytica TaxID=2735899 RepID=A0A8J8GCB0_9FLAO|nr:hypothetical protein [Frigoriflavimonas asaccharolytica]NRS93097.1 hypothetical protein [Frigoriflavimonas asaccharolytica]
MKGNSIDYIEIHTEDYLFVLSGNGQISSISTPILNGNLDYFNDPHYQKEKFGQLQSIDNQQIDYWLTANEADARFGKVKRIGNIDVDYWNSLNYERDKFG